MSRKQVIILVALGAFVAVEIVLFAFTGDGEGGRGILNLPGSRPEAIDIDSSGIADFIPEVPKDVKETLAEVSEVINEGAGAGTKLSVFTIVASKKGYEPSMLVVTEGDTIRLKFASLDGERDIYSPYVGFYLSADKGEESQLSFIAPGMGTYVFRCRDFCPKNVIQGQLIVKPAAEN